VVEVQYGVGDRPTFRTAPLSLFEMALVLAWGLGRCFLRVFCPRREQDPHRPSCGCFEKTATFAKCGDEASMEWRMGKTVALVVGRGQNKPANACVHAGRPAGTHTHRAPKWTRRPWTLESPKSAIWTTKEEMALSSVFKVLRALVKGGEGTWACIEGKCSSVRGMLQCRSVADTRAGCVCLVRS
jgi:hypothetical protein